jgi:uncharacterized paraquat-inducible protein A
MYCPSCGTEINQPLSYCNRCGANLTSLQNKPEVFVSAPKVTGMVWAFSLALTFITLLGFGVVFIFAKEVLDKNMNLGGGAMTLIVFLLAVIVVVDFLLIRQLSRLVGLYLQSGTAVARSPQSIESQPPPAQLDAAREPPASGVTDQTTRKFEPLYRERGTK